MRPIEQDSASANQQKNPAARARRNGGAGTEKRPMGILGLNSYEALAVSFETCFLLVRPRSYHIVILCP